MGKIIEVSTSGSTDKTQKFLKYMQLNSVFNDLDLYGQQGVAALEAATPRDSGIAAGSWYYEISDNGNGPMISWYNSDKDDQGTQIVILIQYGHGTGTGGHVEAIDFINPATKEVFDDISDAVWKAVQSA